MSDLTKKDFLYFQNEILEDIKKVESKLQEKIASLYSYIQEMTLSNEKRFTTLNTIIQNISERNHAENEKNIISQIDRLKKKVEDINLNNTSKIAIMQKDISNTFYKYDKIILDNLKINGLIGEGCIYRNLNFFNEYINKKVKELIIAKDKTNNEIIVIKGKIKDLITQFKTGLENEAIRTNELINKNIIQIDEKCLGRNNILEDKIKEMRLENCKYSNVLLSKADELNVQWEKLENMKNEIYTKFDEEKMKLKKNSENLLHVFNSQKDEFDLIKSRFIEVRDLIKNVRFKKNLNDIVNINNSRETDIKNIKEINNLTKKLNFYKKQKIDKKDIKILNREENKNIIMDNQNETEKNNTSNKQKIVNNISNNIKYINKSYSPNLRNQNKNNIIDIKNHKEIKYIKKDNYKNIYKVNINKDNRIKTNQNQNQNQKNNISQKNKYNETNNINNININNNELKSVNINSDNNDNTDDNEDIKDNNYNENISENEDENYDYEENYKDNNNDNMDIYSGANTQENYIDDYNDNGNNNDKLVIEEKENNYITSKYLSNKKKYTKINIDKNKNKENTEENIITKKNEKDKVLTIKENAKSNLTKKINLINKENDYKSNFAKTLYNINWNKKNILKNNENKTKFSMSSNDIINQKNEIEKSPEKYIENKNFSENEVVENEDEFSEVNFSNNNIRNKILENKNNRNYITKYSSLSEDEKKFTTNNNITFYNSSKIKYRLNSNINTKKETEPIDNYNILPLNFGEIPQTSKENNNNSNINSKYAFKKMMHHINTVNYDLNEKYKQFSKKIYNIFDNIKKDINQIYNEINKLNAYNLKQFGKEKPFNGLINSYDLYNNTGINLYMNKKKVEEYNYHSFFSRNKVSARSKFDEKYESPKSILNNVEPYLIKKFRQNPKNT